MVSSTQEPPEYPWVSQVAWQSLSWQATEFLLSTSQAPRIIARAIGASSERNRTWNMGALYHMKNGVGISQEIN